MAPSFLLLNPAKPMRLVQNLMLRFTHQNFSSLFILPQQPHLKLLHPMSPKPLVKLTHMAPLLQYFIHWPMNYSNSLPTPKNQSVLLYRIWRLHFAHSCPHSHCHTYLNCSLSWIFVFPTKLKTFKILIQTMKFTDYHVCEWRYRARIHSIQTIFPLKNLHFRDDP